MLCFDVFQCIYSKPQCILMYLKVFEYNSMFSKLFIDIIIGISPSHSHYNVFPTHPPTHLLFTIRNLPNMLYHYILFSNFHWSIPTFIQFMKTLHTNFYFSHLYITPHSTFHVVTACAEHSETQVIYCNFLNSIVIPIKIPSKVKSVLYYSILVVDLALICQNKFFIKKRGLAYANFYEYSQRLIYFQCN
jgi:hypothetical protein